MQSLRTVRCKASIRWRSGWSRGSFRSTNDLRVKGGDGHGQAGQCRGPFLGQVYSCTACRWSQLCRLTPIRSPGSLGRTQKHPEETQNRPRTPRQPHPWGPPGADVDHGTPRPSDQETQTLAASSIGLLLFFLLLSSSAACGLLCSRRRREKTSGRSRHSTMTSFRNPCNTIRHCSSYELTHPSQVTTCRVACARRPSRAAAVTGKCLSPLLGIPRYRSLCCCC